MVVPAKAGTHFSAVSNASGNGNIVPDHELIRRGAMDPGFPPAFAGAEGQRGENEGG
jgi:hypothetical protein